MYSLCPACNEEQSVSAVALQLNSGHVSCRFCKIHFDANNYRVDPVRERSLKSALHEKNNKSNQRQLNTRWNDNLTTHSTTVDQNLNSAENLNSAMSEALHKPVSDFFSQLTETVKSARKEMVDMKKLADLQGHSNMRGQQQVSELESATNVVNPRIGNHNKTESSLQKAASCSLPESHSTDNTLLEDSGLEKIKRERLLILKAKLKLELEQERLQLEIEKEKLALEKEKVALEKQKYRMQRTASANSRTLKSVDTEHNVVADVLPRTHTAINDSQPAEAVANTHEKSMKLELTPIEPQKVFLRQLRRK